MQRTSGKLNRISRRWFQNFAVISLVLFAYACDSDEDESSPNPFDEKSIGLTAFEQCDPLLDYFQRQAIEAVERGEQGYGAVMRGGGGSWEEMGAVDAPQAMAEAGGSADSNGAAGGLHSETNNQVAGVDEPDQLKTDGSYIYLLHAGSLFIYGAEDLNLLSTTHIGQGNAFSMLVDGDQLLSFENLWQGDPAFPEAERLQNRGAVALTLFDIGDRSQPVELRRLIVEGNFLSARLLGRTVRTVISYNEGPDLSPAYEQLYNHPEELEPPRMDSAEPIPSAGAEANTGTEADPDEEPRAAKMETRRSALNEQESFIEEASRIIRASSLDDWVPYVYEKVGEEQSSRRLSACGEFYRPGERGGLGVTAILTLDLDQPENSLNTPAIIAQGAIIYSSTENLYVSTYNWFDFRGPMMAEMGSSRVGGASTTSNDNVSNETTPVEGIETREAALEVGELDEHRQATQIHKFDVSKAGGAAEYRGSGRVFGTLLNQFSMDEYEGHLRVATTEQQSEPEWRRINQLFVLGEGGPHGLEITGTVGGIAEGESIYAVRFLGTRGFIVTFLQTDPLFTLDLADPQAPRLVGELKIPGFSTYLHPVNNDFLIGIGQAGDENGLTGGMQLSLFDVSDFAHPKQSDTQSLGGHSEAGYDHHAFLYWAPESLVAVPVNSWSGEGQRSSLELFSLDTESGFGERGAIDHSSFNRDDYEAQINRSLIIGDSIYSVSPAGLKRNAILDLSEQAAVELPRRGV